MDGSAEEDVEIVFPRHHLEPFTISQVKKEEEETVPDLWDYGRIEAILSLGLGLLVEGAYNIDDGEYSAI